MSSSAKHLCLWKGYGVPLRILILAGIFCVVPWEWAQAQSVGGAVLLKNDRLLEGEVVPSGDFYTVRVAEQSRVSIPKSQVAKVAANKVELYEFKKASISRWEVGDHFQLTRWCLLNGLHSQAVEHYQQVAAVHRDHPRVRQLALELRGKLLEVPGFREYLGLEERASTVPDRAERDQVGPSKAVVSASANVTAAAMHPQIAAHFSRRIQPILLNRCAQPACHGPQSQNGLRIIEPYRDAFEQVSSDNLRSVLTQVSMDADKLSPLLRYATTAHGIQRQAGISITETNLLTEVTNWIQFVQNPVATAVAERGNGTVQSMSSAPRSGLGASVHFEPFSPAVRLVPVQPGESGLKPVPGGGAGPDPAGFPDGDIPLESEIEALDRQLQRVLGENPGTKPAALMPGGPSPTLVPGGGASPAPAQGPMPSVDPFDPAEFNRQSQSRTDTSG